MPRVAVLPGGQHCNIHTVRECMRVRDLSDCRVVVAQWSERRQLRSEALGSISSGCPCIFSESISDLIYHQFLYHQFVTDIVAACTNRTSQ